MKKPGVNGRKSVWTLIAVSIVLIAIVATPARANDDDDDDDGGPPPTTTTSTTSPPLPPPTTTTTLPPTTTTTAPPVTTTAPPPPVTTTTRPPAPATTTTTLPTTPTSSPFDREDIEPDRSLVVVTTSTTVPVNDEYELKDSLVISAAGGTSGGGTSGGERLGRSHISPRQGLTVAFRSAVETIQNQLLLAITLGLVIAVFVMLGVDKRRWEAVPRPSRLSSI